MSKITEIIENIKNPPREYGPIPFWFLNDAFCESEIERQLKEFCEKGVYGVVLHPRIGIPESIEYLSDEFMHYIEVAVKCASRLDMKVVLYDEAMYPSGSAHGKVVAENSDYAAQGIFLTDNPCEGKLIATTESGKYIVQKNTEGTIRGIHWGEDDGEMNAPKAADLLSQESVDCFIRLTHQRYYDWLGNYFGNTIIGFFTDEPDLLGRACKPKCHAWTWGFEEVIEKQGGKLSQLEGLFTGEENETVTLYKKSVFERECEVYYSALQKWCNSHGISLMGHPQRADDIECERFFGIPGQDLVLRRVEPGSKALSGEESVQAKCSSDAARILGAERNSNECYGACCREKIPWYFTGEDLKWFTDWLGVRGVNMFIPHAFYYSIRGKRKDERPPDVGPNNIWWKYFDVISTYIKRISYIMANSSNTAKVCVMCDNRNVPSDEIAWLYKNQIEFNYVPYNFVKPDMYRDGRLLIGDNSYEYICNDWKSMFPEMKHVEKAEDISHRDIYIGADAEDLRVSVIVKNGVKMWFLVNEGEENIETEARLSGQGEVIRFDLWRGTVNKIASRRENAQAVFKLKLKRRESALFILADEALDFAEEKEKNYADLKFELVSEDEKNFVKTYRGSFIGTADNLYIRFSASDMAECFVNGSFCGFGLWNEHEFYISPYLKDGVNKIELRISANAANKFSDKKVPYGLSVAATVRE